jgi:hypothetical protein
MVNEEFKAGELVYVDLWRAGLCKAKVLEVIEPGTGTDGIREQGRVRVRYTADRYAADCYPIHRGDVAEVRTAICVPRSHVRVSRQDRKFRIRTNYAWVK